MGNCPCGSGKPFAACCEPYLSGVAPAPTAEALMRSRYTAYTRSDFDYLKRTWDAATRPATLGAEPGLEWLVLSVIKTQAGSAQDYQGTVQFVARYRIGEAQGELRETSRFHKRDGVWLYLDGHVEQTAHPRATSKAGRNDPCPCGSGKKFKKCCGA